MNSRLLFAFLCIASISTGCIVVDDDCNNCNRPPAAPGDATFLWTFNGLRCDQARDVYGVNITIPGESLLNNGKYACSTAGVDGITLHDFVPGTYNFTLQAVNFQNQIIFEASGNFVINGNRTVMVDLAPVGNPTSYAYLNWNFPGGMSCAQAGVATVDVTVNDQTKNFACHVGQATPGLQTLPLNPGEHFVEFIALDSAGRPLYYFNGGLVTQAYNPVSASYNLYAVGGASISWLFSDGSVTFECPAVNPDVYINFQDVSTGNWVYAGLGDRHVCNSKPIVFEYLKPGDYKVFLYSKVGNTEYRSNPNIPPVRIQAHVFPGPNSALNVTMYR